jgi:hypothetical protein
LWVEKPVAICGNSIQSGAASVQQERDGKIILKGKPLTGQEKPHLVAYISESRDREGNTFYVAAICAEEKNEIIEELSDYARPDLEREVRQRYPEIDLETA